MPDSTPDERKLFLATQGLSLLRVRRDVKPYLTGDRFWEDWNADRDKTIARRKNPWEPLPRSDLFRSIESGEFRRVAVVCSAGLGKTANLKWLAAHLRGGCVPFRFKLSDPDLPGTATEFWQTTLSVELSRTCGNDNLDELRLKIRSARDGGRVVLFLDSVDEASDNGMKLLRDLVKPVAGLSFGLVVSARPHAIFDNWKDLVGPRESDWRFVRVEGLNEDRRKRLLGPYVPGVDPDGPPDLAERTQLGAIRYTRIPPAGRRLLENPRHLMYVRKNAEDGPVEASPKSDVKRDPDNRTSVPAEDSEPGDVSVYKLEHFRTASHLYAGAADHAVRMGMRAEKSGRLGIKRNQETVNDRVDFALDLLSALAYAMYGQRHPATTDADTFRPNVSHVPNDQLGKLRVATIKLLKAANLVEPNYDAHYLETVDLPALDAANSHVKFDLLDHVTLKTGNFRWHDRTLQEFFAARWLARYATADDSKQLKTWRYDNRMRTEKSLYEPLWGFLVEMPKAVRRINWFDAVKTLFEPGATRCCEMIVRCGQTFERMTGADKTRANGIVKSWQGEFATMSGPVATSFRSNFASLAGKNSPLPGDTGRFWMGSHRYEKERYEDESFREETVQPFRIGRGPVTNAEYELFDPGHETEREWKSQPDIDRHPVVNVDWWEASAFALWVGGKLPTEVEWEYACRGGTASTVAESLTHPYYWGQRLNGDYANCDGKHPYATSNLGEYVGNTTVVGKYKDKAPHPWGLVDVHGNVLEWCENWFDRKQTDRAIRGGSWGNYARTCRAALRGRSEPKDRDDMCGFRVIIHEKP